MDPERKLPAEPVEPSWGDLLGSARALLGPIGRLFGSGQLSPLDQVRLKLAQLELAEKLEGGVVPVVMAMLEQLLTERQDWVIVGSRGSGKTAAAMAIGQKLCTALGVQLRVLEAPSQVVSELGGRTIEKAHLEALRDAVLVLDEAAVRFNSSKRDSLLYELLVLARQRNVSVICTAQTLAGVPLDVLRMDVRLAFKRGSDVAARVDREELRELSMRAQAIIARFPEFEASKAAMLIYESGRWLVSANGLPDGWSDRASKLWA